MKKYFPFAIFVSLFVIHNFIWSDNVAASEGIYLAYFLLVIIGGVVTLVRSCLYGNKLTGKHTAWRFWASNIISIVLVLFFGFQGIRLASDIVNLRVVDGVFQVHSNLDNLAGAWVLQQPDVSDGEEKIPLKLLLRVRYLRVGERYHLRYAERSGFILTAEKPKSAVPR